MTLLEKFLFLKPVISRLTRLMTSRQKFFLVIMLVFTIGFSLVETIGITAIMPFISIVSQPSLLESGYYKMAYDFFAFASPEKFMIFFGLCIVIFYFLRGGYCVMLAYLIKRFSLSMYKYFTRKALTVNLKIPYKVHTQRNTGELIRAIQVETVEVGKVVLHLLTLCSEMFTIILVYTVIVILNWKMTLVLTFALFTIVIILMSIITRINSVQGKISFSTGRTMSRTVKESLSNMKYVKLKGNEEEIITTYNNALEAKAKSELITHVLGAMPRGVLESIGFSFLIAVVVLIIMFNNNTSMIIPVISMYALALYKILPSIIKSLQEINGVVYSEEILKNVYDNLIQPVEDEGNLPINFEKSIRLENISFQYLTGAQVISDISLEIKKGEKIAFTGESGGGKSTLVDIIIGIHKPLLGIVSIDDIQLTNDNIRSWRKKIGYIPQNIYLFDGTVAENVSFGSVYDEEKIKAALIKANIWDFLSQKEGINTRVGDGGIQLSGGQQQRICIARAIYDDPDVLVLDEATSALDNETEQKIMDEIYNVSKNKTLIIIAHRLSTVEHCERRIRIVNGKIVE
ncbi:MAG: ABC transporter ATP-binding protein/permease [Treponema sp.]|jgi:ATP-binding cassette subfamily B protein/ATP-binding cassette subfamily C protein|nr:ABC transporter ATP-binding protein/permease [Treponema sp.]